MINGKMPSGVWKQKPIYYKLTTEKPVKKIISILIMTALLMSCDSNKGSEQKPSEDTVSEKHEEHEEKSGVLKLNNGTKWKIDSVTAVNVGLLKTIVSDAKTNKPANYTETTAKLQDGLNKLIKECKMSGADHDALHQWLEPMIEKTKELKNAGSADSAKTILTGIEQQLNLFDQYFEL